jgi:hypothetical protein
MEAEPVVIPTFTVKTMTDRAISVELIPAMNTIKDVREFLLKKHDIPATKLVLLIRRGLVLGDTDPVPEVDGTIYLFYYDPSALVLDPIDVAVAWDAKNRMKVFKGLYLFSQRRFHEAAGLLIGSLTTFQEVNFIPFRDCVKYACLTVMLVMDRPTIQQKLIKSPEVLEVINELPHMETLINAFYNCRYAEFFAALAAMEACLKEDWLASAHTQFIIKELRIRAYSQMLQSYRSLTLASMAASFGVSVDFIEREIGRFIAAGRLTCVIDKVSGIVVTNPPDARNTQYVNLVKQGDVLLSSMQKLERVLTNS